LLKNFAHLCGSLFDFFNFINLKTVILNILYRRTIYPKINFRGDKMKNGTLSLIIFSIFFFYTNSFSQNLWSVYTTSNSGLVTDTVTSIYLDDDEIYWYGTSMGVTKYDGINWTNYTKSNSPFEDAMHIFSILKLNDDYYFGGWLNKKGFWG